MLHRIANQVFVLVFISLLFSAASFAAPPTNVRGKLVFLGKTNDLSQSVWLSVTSAGSFQLEAQGNQLIDSWSESSRGTHVSVSPIVSQGNGGTHFLVDAVTNRNLDSQNQQGGIIFPPLPELPPGVVTPPIAIPPGNGTPPSGGIPTHPIVVPPDTGTGGSGGSAPSGSHTGGSTSSSSGSGGNEPAAPITKGRQIYIEPLWNIWTDNYYYNINDNRHNLESKGATTNFNIGVDRRMSDHLVAGILLSRVGYHVTAINNSLANNATGYNIGPYFGYLITPNWSSNGSLTYGYLQNKNKVSSLNSSYRTQVASGVLQATGAYPFGHFQLRPQPLVSYTHYSNPAYAFNGLNGGAPVQVNRNSESYNFGYAQFKLEGNYSFETRSANLVQPYVDAGIDYVFAQPNDGQVLTGNLTLATVSPTTETLEVGVRSIISRVFLIDVSGGYLSFGQTGLSVWEMRLLASYSFA